jgi:hypothetical protein
MILLPEVTIYTPRYCWPSNPVKEKQFLRRSTAIINQLKLELGKRLIGKAQG